MNKTDCLIVFVRYPELGKVKTRIAIEIGCEKALAVYQELLSRTFSTVEPLKCVTYIFVTGSPDIPLDIGFQHKVSQQQGNNIGERMQNAFHQVFTEGFSKVVLIGSDIYELTTGIISDAFQKLDEVDCVIGRAKDGGYYLLGLTHELPSLFTDVTWSSPHTFDHTIRKITFENLTYRLLPELNDVDTVEDIYKHKKLIDLVNEN